MEKELDSGRMRGERMNLSKFNTQTFLDYPFYITNQSQILSANITNPVSSWNLHPRRRVSERELSKVAALLSTLERIKVCVPLENKWVWDKEGFGIFTSKSLFKTLIDKPFFNHYNFYHFIWKTPIPNKVRVFGWLLTLKKLNTQDLLQKRQPFLSISPSWCVMCRNGSESINHLFLHCLVAQRI